MVAKVTPSTAGKSEKLAGASGDFVKEPAI
jgi:hypothetical protein